MKIIEAHHIFDNPLPQLKSRQSYFPFACECKDGTLVAFTYIGEAMESMDAMTYVCRSQDGGRTWSKPVPLLDRSQFSFVISDSCKPAVLKDGRIAVIGYGYIREDPELPQGNPETGGLLDDIVFWLISEDNGLTWSKAREINCAWGRHVEASAPLTILQDGTWITPITGFPKWDGTMTGRLKMREKPGMMMLFVWNFPRIKFCAMNKECANWTPAPSSASVGTKIQLRANALQITTPFPMTTATPGASR